MFVITGVSGRTGAVAAETLLEQGKRVRVVVRERGKAARFEANGAEVAVADMGDRDALARALTGAEGAYLLLPPNLAATDVRAFQRSTSEAIVDAVARAKVPHVVLLSSIGAEQSAGTGPIVGLHELEQRLGTIASLRTTAIRAASFIENLGGALGMLEQGLLPSFTPAGFAYDMIATADIGRLAAAELVEGGRTSSVIELGAGPWSTSDVATEIGTIVGKPIRVAEAALDAVVPTFMGFGMQQDMAELYREMLGAIISGKIRFSGQHRTVRGSTGLAPVLAGLLPK